MPPTFFNIEQFASQIFQCEHERETEELIMSLKEYIHNMMDYIHELEMEKYNLESEVASLQDRVDEFEC